MSRYQLLLLGIAVAMLYAGFQTAVANEALAAGVATVGAIIAAVKPLLSPEQAAKLEMIAHNVDGTVQATATAVSTIVDVIGAIKTNATEQFQGIAKATQELQVAIASKPSLTESTVVGGGVAAAGDIASFLTRSKSRAQALAKVAHA